jgi:hypothetical protein
MSDIAGWTKNVARHQSRREATWGCKWIPFLKRILERPRWLSGLRKNIEKRRLLYHLGVFKTSFNQKYRNGY